MLEQEAFLEPRTKAEQACMCAHKHTHLSRRARFCSRVQAFFHKYDKLTAPESSFKSTSSWATPRPAGQIPGESLDDLPLHQVFLITLKFEFFWPTFLFYLPVCTFKYTWKNDLLKEFERNFFLN